MIVPILPRGSSERNQQPRLHERSSQSRLAEAEGLARAIELEIVHCGLVSLSRVKPGTLFGTGKVEEFKGLIAALDAGLVIVDHPLSPVQQRNLEKAWNAKVLDRTGLILEIFGARAQTKEGRLQVELAHLNYQKGRLVRSWTHLERQRGGGGGSGGFLGGPGETQIESDRRQLQERVNKLERELEKVRRTRSLHRAQRKNAYANQGLRPFRLGFEQFVPLFHRAATSALTGSNQPFSDRRRRFALDRPGLGALAGFIRRRR